MWECFCCTHMFSYVLVMMVKLQNMSQDVILGVCKKNRETGEIRTPALSIPDKLT